MILLKLDPIKGDSKVDGHVDWISVDSFQFGVGRAVTTSGASADRDVSNPSVSEVVITKSTDKASSDLWMAALCGKSEGKAEIHFVQTGGVGAAPQVYLAYVLEGALVSSFSISSGGERPVESISLNFTKVTMTYNAFSGAEVTTGDEKKWDIALNKTY